MYKLFHTPAETTVTVDTRDLSGFFANPCFSVQSLHGEELHFPTNQKNSHLVCHYDWNE